MNNINLSTKKTKPMNNLHEGQKVKIKCFAFKDGRTQKGIIKTLTADRATVLIDGNKKATKFAQCWLIPDEPKPVFKNYLIEVYHDHIDPFRSIRVHRGTFEQNRDGLSPSMIDTYNTRAETDSDAITVAKRILKERKATGTHQYKLDTEIFD